jgi:hypothetical protein
VPKTTDRTNVSQREPPKRAMRSTYALEASRAPYVLDVTRSRHPAAVAALQPARLNARTGEPNSEDGVSVPGTQEQRGAKLEEGCTRRRDAIALGPQEDGVPLNVKAAAINYEDEAGRSWSGWVRRRRADPPERVCAFLERFSCAFGMTGALGARTGAGESTWRVSVLVASTSQTISGVMMSGNVRSGRQ